MAAPSDDEELLRREAVVRERVSRVLSEYGLSGIGKAAAMAYLQKLSSDDMARVRQWWMRRLNGKELLAPEGTPPGQMGCPEIMAGLRSSAFWESSLFSWVKDLEASAPVIRNELLSLRQSKGFQAYRSGADKKSTDAGAWNVYYLDLHGCDLSENRLRCPETVKILDAIPKKYGHAFFSATAPGTHITPHHGPTTKKIRCQLPLVCPKDSCRLRVDSKTVTLEEGRALLFDDSFEHEAWNDHPSESRIVLIVDTWHPDLSPREIKFLSFLQNAALKKLQKTEKGDTKDMFSLIDEGMQRGVRNTSEIWGCEG